MRDHDWSSNQNRESADRGAEDRKAERSRAPKSKKALSSSAAKGFNEAGQVQSKTSEGPRKLLRKEDKDTTARAAEPAPEKVENSVPKAKASRALL